MVANRNKNFRISRTPFKIQAHQGTSLFTNAATNKGVVQRVVLVSWIWCLLWPCRGS